MERKGQISMLIEFINKSKTFFIQTVLLFIITCFSFLSIAASATTYTFTGVGADGTGNNAGHKTISTSPAGSNIEISNNMEYTSGILFPDASGTGSVTFTIKGDGVNVGSFDVHDMLWGNFTAETTLDAAITKIIFTKTNLSTVTWNSLTPAYQTNLSFDTGDHSILSIFTSSSTVTNVTQIEVTVDLELSGNISNFEIRNIVLANLTAPVSNTPPTVTTTTASSIAANSATLGGNVTNDGGASVTERGVVYAISALNADPEVGGANVTKVANGAGTGVFSAPISGLLSNTAYSFKSYATNSQGTSYGSVDTFATLVPPTITFADISKTYGDANFNLGATTNSGGTISYTIEGVNTTGTTLSGVSNLTVNLANAGTITIRASVTANGIYSAGTKDITLTINKATLTAIADNKSRVYGDLNPAFTISYSGFKNSETTAVLTVESTASSIATSTTNVGTVDIDVSGGLDNNYNFLYVKGTLTIGKATLTTTADNKAKAYGDINPAFTLSYSGFKNGETSAVLTIEPTGSSIATSTTNVGTVDIDVSGGLDNNYNFLYVKGTLTIGKATLTATADNKAKYYGDANPAFTISYSGFKNSETSAVLTVESTGSSIATSTTNVGTVDIDVAGGLDNNYNFLYVKGTLTIGKATLTTTADNKSRAYGDANPTFTISYGGFKNGDTTADLTVEPTASSIATSATNAGTVDIDVAGGLDDNYDFLYVKGTLTITGITGISITISANAQSKIAGDADPTLTYQLTSGALESGDTFTGSLSRSAGESAGSYVINQGSVQADAKYDITYISATFTISPKPVNHAPVISGSPATTVAEGTAYRFSPTVTDSDAGDSKRFSITNKPTWALFNTASGALTGTPTDSDIGKTSGIVISVKDSGNVSARLSAFNVEVTSTNTLPVAISQSVDVQEDSEVSITLEGSDADNDELTFVVTQQPTHGSLSLSSTSDATWLYKANENYNGSDEFSYKVKDKEGSSEPALVSIAIAPVNDKPLAEDDNVALNFNEVGSYTINVLANDSDVDGDTLSIVSASANIGSVTVNNNQLVYQLNGAIQGGIQLSYLIDDGSGTENSRAKASVNLLIEGDVNTQLPIITLPADIEYNADALFTKIDLGVATAMGKNGEIVPVFLVDGNNMFKPGNNLAYWKAVDEDGLEQTATQKVKVQPLITIGKDAVGAEGQHYSVGVYLNGTAPDYPVVVPYTVSGSADENDHLLTSGELVITQGVEGVIDIETLVDDIDEDSETLIITLSGGKNLGAKSSFTLTLIEGNIAPALSYSVTQNDEQRLLIEANSADVVIQSVVIDANASDTHTYTWQSPDGQLSDIDINDNSFTFATTDLAEGLYQVTLTVTDDGVPVQSTSTVIYLEVTAALATLTDADSDGDLIPDNQEGFGDADLDGIPDYLDGANPCNVMPQRVADSHSFLVEGESGVCLRKGLTVANNETGGIQLQGSEVAPDEETDNVGGLFDFVAYGLPSAGQSYNLVLPQRLPIPENAVYRKYKADGGWVDFVVDDNNYYSSSAGELGFCPPPLDTMWVKGLHPGDWCVQITIEDGGPNDDDGEANNTIVDPSGVAVLLNSNTQPSVTSQELTLAWNTSVTIDVLNSATDIDGDLLIISSANVDFGEVLIEGEQLVYTPAESFFGEALIHFGVDDNNGGTAYGTVAIQVIENQVPQAINDEVSTDDVSTIIIDVLANDSDDDADTLTILTADAEHGVVSITEKNTLSYTSLAGYDGIDMIAYTISDGHDGSADAQVKVTVTALEATVDKNKSGGGSLGYFILLLSGLAFKVRRNRGFFI